MEKFREYIETWINGKKVKGINVSLYDIQECIDVYNAIVRKENIEFINVKVKKILDKCNIKTVTCGIGWKLYNKTEVKDRNRGNKMKLVKCISRRELLPKQIEEGNTYYLDETSLYVDSDGDEYAKIYKDRWKKEYIGTMLTQHFCEPILCN